MADIATCIVAEDETLLRHALVAELKRAWPALQVVAECEDGASAVEALAEHTPDIAFLDIRMPGLTGLEVAALAAEASPRTQIVFVTAYDQYAIDAFERGAIDYLLKPVKPERLDATVARLQAREQDLKNREETFKRRLDQRIEERLRDARKEIDAVVDALKEKTQHLAVEAERKAARLIPTGQTGGARADARAAIDAIGERLRNAPTESATATATPVGRPAAVGDRVIVGALALEGVVRSIQGGTAEVEVRGKRLRSKVDDLRVVAPASSSAPAKNPTPSNPSTPTASSPASWAWATSPPCSSAPKKSSTAAKPSSSPKRPSPATASPTCASSSTA